MLQEQAPCLLGEVVLLILSLPYEVGLWTWSQLMPLRENLPCKVDGGCKGLKGLILGPSGKGN